MKRVRFDNNTTLLIAQEGCYQSRQPLYTCSYVPELAGWPASAAVASPHLVDRSDQRSLDSALPRRRVGRRQTGSSRRTLWEDARCRAHRRCLDDALRFFRFAGRDALALALACGSRPRQRRDRTGGQELAGRGAVQRGPDDLEYVSPDIRIFRPPQLPATVPRPVRTSDLRALVRRRLLVGDNGAPALVAANPASRCLCRTVPVSPCPSRCRLHHEHAATVEADEDRRRFCAGFALACAIRRHAHPRNHDLVADRNGGTAATVT